MIKSIIDYVKYHYQFCENIDSSFLSNNLDTNECYIKSSLIYKYLFELYFRKNITLNEIMSLMDITDFLFHDEFSCFEKSLDIPSRFQNLLEKTQKRKICYLHL